MDFGWFEKQRRATLESMDGLAKSPGWRIRLAVWGLFAVAGCGGARHCGGHPESGNDGPARRPRTRPATETSTFPRRGAAGSRRVTQADLDKRVAALRKKLDDRFSFFVHKPFVAAGDVGRTRLKRYVAQSVIHPAQAMWASYFDKKPTDVITVLLFDGQRSYRQWAAALFGDRKVSYFGYYRFNNRTLVMDIGTGSGTLIHELTHALIMYDFPQVPTWFNEALASLHEACYVYPDRLVGTLNWRLPGLKKALADGTLRPLRALVTKRDFTGKQMGLNYAQARYFALYLQKQKKLKAFYVRFRDSYTPEKPNDVEIIEAVLKKKIAVVDTAYRRWVAGLKAPRAGQ
jgi:hypothetical protein